MLYRHLNEEATPSSIRCISLDELAHLDTAAKALLAADLVAGCVALTPATAGALMGVSATYVRAAQLLRRRRPDLLSRLAHEPLYAVCRVAGIYFKPSPDVDVAGESLVEHFARTTRAEWRAVAQVIGPAVIWDEMVAPLIA